MHEKVYCIIVLYNAMQWIDKCLSSLKASEMPVSVVCVDNGSKDATCSYIQDIYPDITLIKNTKNRGFGQANNQGIEYAYKNGGTHFFLLNQDAWVFPSTIGDLMKVQREFNLGLVSPIHLNGTQDCLDYNFFDALVVRPKNNVFVRDLLMNVPRPYYQPVFTPCAAAWLLSRECIERVGGFDPLFFHYGEDANYFQRVLYHSIGVGVVPQSFICHDRKYHGNIEVYNKRRTETKLLIQYADVREDSKLRRKERLKLHVFFIKAYLRSLFSFRLIKSHQIVGGYIRFFKKRVLINNSIITNRTEGASWLHL